MSQPIDATRRSGAVLFEVVIASILVGAAVFLCLQMSRLWLAQARRGDQERIARNEATNILERLSYDGVQSGQDFDRYELSPAAKESLPEAKLSIQTSSAPEPASGLVRATVSVDWQSADGARSPLVRLVTFLRAAPPQEPVP